MNPFESARTGAAKLREELDARGVDLSLGGYALVKAACAAYDINLRPVKPSVRLLKSADATINVVKKWILVRNDVPDEIKAFLVAHELGHWRLHPLTLGTVEVMQAALTGDGETNGVKEVEGYGSRERQELQANVFAREFLLPKAVARSLFLDDRLAATDIARSRELPDELVRLQIYDAVLLPQPTISAREYKLPDGPTPAQQPAVDSDAPVSLIEAGPGTGKTTTLLLRLRRLIAAGAHPESIVILTFSNRAARELVERARAGGIAGADRVWIGTFHAFGLEFLRKFGKLLGLKHDLPVLDRLAALAMLERDLPSLGLQSYDSLSNPSPWLENVLAAIKRSKDEVLDAKAFKAAVEADTAADAPTLAKREDVAAIFERYELLLERRQAVDLNDLLGVTIRLMQGGDATVAHYLGAIRHVMVDEYQDVNRASALLVRTIHAAAHPRRTLWVVGDANQAIYAFMGASSSNLDNFQADFPGAVPIPLALNHRSSQEIVDAFTVVAGRNPAGRPTVALKAEKDRVGHGPRLVNTSSGDEEIDALAWRIRDLHAQGVRLAEQAVIVYKNATAATLAAGLELSDVPVLYLGNIFERPEVKDLICLMQLAVDPYGVNLVREWRSPLLALSRAGADAVFAKSRSDDKPWNEVTLDTLDADDRNGLSALVDLCSLIDAKASPWDALATVLLEDGRWLRELASRSGQNAANAMMAVWQFVHFCRSPDGTGRWATVKNLPQRIRDRVRLGEDRSMRIPPPEAEGLDAVRVLTAHGSKGLEFDAVHLLEVTKAIYEPTSERPNQLLPAGVLSAEAAAATLKNERHNLLYVGTSRPRLYLTVYGRAADDLPTALTGVLAPLSGPWQGRATAAVPATKTHATVVGMQEYLEFTKCPQRFEMGSRAGGKSQRDEMKLYRAIDLATTSAMRALRDDPQRRQEGTWQVAVNEALEEFDLVKQPAAASIAQRVTERVRNGLGLLAEGGKTGVTVNLPLGPLQVTLTPDQVFEAGGVRTLRFFRNSEGSFATAIKQQLAALLDANRQAGGPPTQIEYAILADGRKLPVGKIQEKTRSKYIEIATNLCSRHFPAAPVLPRTCMTCSYLFPCHKRAED
jgi:superfamily I DNA/RNA helicase